MTLVKNAKTKRETTKSSARPARPDAEAINDYSGEVINLFRILQRHYAAFMDHLKFQLTSRREFERLANTNPQT